MHAQKVNKICLGPKIGEGGDDKQVINLIRPYILIWYQFFLKLSLSEVHFNTGRLLFEFNGLQYRFAAGQVFIAFANPVSVSFG